jgi:hypothetical protein
VAGTPDDLGRPGRSLSFSGSDGGLACSSSADPWPGSFYSVPLLAVLAVGLLATAVALRLIALRPRVAGARGAPLDDVLRRRSARACVAAGGLLVSVPAIGVTVTAGATLRTLVRGSCAARAWWGTGGAIVSWTALPCLALPCLAPLVWCLTVLVTPGPPTGEGRE